MEREYTSVTFDQLERLHRMNNTVWQALRFTEPEQLEKWIAEALMTITSLREKVRELEEHMVHVSGYSYVDPSVFDSMTLRDIPDSQYRHGNAGLPQLWEPSHREIL